MTSRTTKVFLASGLLILSIIIGTVVWIRSLGSYTPAEAYLDLRAAAGAKGAERPVERFLEIRYGALADPQNRQKALLDFFNVDHITGLYLVLQRMPQERRQARIAEMADWIAKYRQTMSAEEKETLRAYFDSAEGKAKVQKATSGYLKKDSRFRAETSPVIKQLMTTLVALPKQ